MSRICKPYIFLCLQTIIVIFLNKFLVNEANEDHSNLIFDIVEGHYNFLVENRDLLNLKVKKTGHATHFHRVGV
jgi:hypothetical protein